MCDFPGQPVVRTMDMALKVNLALDGMLLGEGGRGLGQGRVELK